MTWESIWKALIPSVQSAVYALLAMVIGVGGTYAVNKEKAAVSTPAAPQSCVAAAPARSPQSDQTKLQLVGIQNTLDQIVEVAREINGKDSCGPKKTAAKVK